MILFTITGMFIWLVIIVLAAIIAWDMLPAKVRNFLPDLWFAFSCLWGFADKKLCDLNFLIAKRQGDTNWFMRIAKWILNERVSK